MTRSIFLSKAKPILFNTDMVRAILDGRKTVTRRIAFQNHDLHEFPRPDRPNAWWFRGRMYIDFDDALKSPQGVMSLCKYRPGNILYVRETWNFGYIETSDAEGCTDAWFEEWDWRTREQHSYLNALSRFWYKADNDDFENVDMIWRPSIHMPKEAARIFLRVTDVRVERLQEITDDDIQREGVHDDPYTFAASDFYDRPELKDNYSKSQFAGLWNNTIKPADRERYGWAANPWVWVIEFERVEVDHD